MSRRRIAVALGGLILIGIVLGVWLMRRPKFGEGPIDVETLCQFELDPVKGSLRDVPARIRQLDGRRVTIRGEMWEPMSNGNDWVTRFDMTSLSAFREYQVPRVQDYVKCIVDPERRLSYYSDQVEATGIFHAAVRRDSEDRPDQIASVFTMDVDAINETPYATHDFREVVMVFGIMVAVLVAILMRNRVVRFLMLNPGSARASLRESR